MGLDQRQVALLQALVRREGELREEGRPLHFMLLQMPGPSFGLKPSIEREAEIAPAEPDVYDLEDEGFVRILPSNSSSVVAKFLLTSAGRSAGQPRAVSAELQRPAVSSAPPSADELLEWLSGLAATGPGSAILQSGGALMNEALARWPEQLEAVAKRLLDLRDEGLLLFDDPAAEIDQIGEAERLAHAADFRMTIAGVDRARRQKPALPGVEITNAVEGGEPAPREEPDQRPTAFISWAHGSVEWERTVLDFTTALRTVGGVDADLDLWHHAHEQWTAFGPSGIRNNEFILVAVDHAYRERWEGTNEPHEGAGAAREAASIKAIFERDQKESLKRVKVVILPGSTEEDVPDELLGFAERTTVRSFDLAELEQLLRWLYNRPEFIKPPLGPLPALPPRFVAELENAPAPVGKDGSAAPAPESMQPDSVGNGGAEHDAATLQTRLDQLDGALKSFHPDTGGGATLARDRVYDELVRERSSVKAALDALERSSAGGATGAPSDGGTEVARDSDAALAPGKSKEVEPAPPSHPSGGASRGERMLSDRLRAQLDAGVRLRHGIPRWPGIRAIGRPETTQPDVDMWVKRTQRILRGEDPELLSEFNYRPAKALLDSILPEDTSEPRYKKALDQRIANLKDIIVGLREYEGD